ncbi:MAG: VKORC1/thioredoxin domain-containing protein [Parcubacteria group bacterium Gr01-1014_31]|nr:MAG: VKORC1/thioredoxin domain-containing protein [Parcubacteria group bacterium Gr01-1014_31]
MRPLLFLAATAASVVVAGCAQQSAPASEASTLAACLTERGVIMYGADWCSHCQKQKGLFGDAFSAVTYVECPDEPERCVRAGITGYPTWILPGGQKLEGVQQLPALANAAGCAKSVTP